MKVLFYFVLLVFFAGNIAFAQTKADSEITLELQTSLQDRYDQIWDYQDGMVAVQKGDVWGFCDITGKEVIKPQFISSTTFTNGYADVAKEHGKVGAIDKTGKLVIPFEYDYLGNYENGVFAARKIQNDTEIYGFIDIQNKVVIPFEYEDLSVNWFESGVACVRKNEKWGAINMKNEVLIPFVYDWLSGFDRDKDITVAQNSKGKLIINKQNKVIIPAGKYDDIIICTHGLLLVEKGKKSGLIQADGTEVIALKEGSTHCPDGDYFLVSGKKGTSYLLNLHTKEKLFADKNYLNIDRVTDNAYVVTSESDPLYYLVDKNGVKKTSQGFTTMTVLAENLIMVYDKQSDKSFYINSEGKIISEKKD